MFFGFIFGSSEKIKSSRSGASAIENRDTIRFRLKPIDLKPEIVDKLALSFSVNEFKSIIMFCDEYVTFYYVGSDGNHVKKELTDYGAIEELQDFLKRIDYVKFAIICGTDELNEEVINTTIFYIEKDQVKSIDIFFVLDKNQSINRIIVK